MELQDKVYPQKPSSNDWRDLPQIPQKTGKKQPTRKNPWGNRSYADLITQAIQNAPEKKLTLSQIYDWMVKNIPHFKDKGENNSSAGWKNSIRHNLSLHTRFVRVQNDVTGKSSWWIIDPEGGDGRVTRRRPSAKGDRTRTYRRQRSKPKIQQPGTKCVSTQDQALISSSFSQPAHLTGNYTTVSIPQYLPRDPIWHSEWGQRQRWHSSSSCSSEEVILDSSRIFRALSPEFQQPRSPLSDRNSSGFSSPSSESEPGDAFSISYPAVCSFSAFQDGMGRWITSPESSLEHPRPATLVQGSWDGLNESTSYQWEAREFPNEILADSNLFPKSNHTVHLSHPHGDPNYDFSTPSSTCSSNCYYTVNTRNDYDSRICSPELPSDSDDMPSPNLYVSSQCTIALIDFYNNPRECEKYNKSPYSYSSSDPEGSLFDHSDKPSCALNAVECLGDDAIPEDLRTCHIHPGIECNVSDVIAHEIEMEGQLMFLDCFKDPVRS